MTVKANTTNTTNTTTNTTDTTAENAENLNTVENNDIIPADDKAQDAPDSAGAQQAPEDTRSAERIIIESQKQQIDALAAHIDSLNEQIAHIIRTGGSIGTPQTGVAPDTGTGDMADDLPDFSSIAKNMI